MSYVQENRFASAVTRNGRRVIVAQPEYSDRRWLMDMLTDEGYQPVGVRCPRELMTELKSHDDPTVIMDSEFDQTGGLTSYAQMLLDGHLPRVVFVAGHPRSEVESRAMRMGATDYVGPAIDAEQVRKAIQSAIRNRTVRPGAAAPLLGDSAPMKELRGIIRNIAATDAAVMIVGESGTGKELVARAIHDCSQRTAGDFVPVNMAALPESLVESVLFGHEKGSFTGAEKRQPGLCHQAHKGTLFLDEIGEMCRDLQPKLLRFLQEYTVQRVGSTQTEHVDVRVISATNRDLKELIGSGGFREDLFFRLNVIPVHVPALRDRKDDIPLLATSFLKRKCQRLGRHIEFSGNVIERLCEYDWPGNIRQLENLIERMVVLTQGDVIDACAVPLESFSTGHRRALGSPTTSSGQLVTDLEEVIVLNNRQLTRSETAERNLIIHALHCSEGNVGAAAKYLGLGQATVYRKIKDFEIRRTMRPE